MIKHKLLEEKRASITIAHKETNYHISFSEKALEMLGNPKYILYRLVDEYLIISASNEGYAIESVENRKIVKCTLLIKEIVKHFSLDKNKKYFVCSNIKAIDGEEKTIAVKIK